jgi:hypothetical protein
MELFRKQAWVEDPFLLGVVLGLLVIFSNLVGLIWRSKMHGEFFRIQKDKWLSIFTTYSVQWPRRILAEDAVRSAYQQEVCKSRHFLLVS